MMPAHLNKKAPPKRGLRRLRDVPPRRRARHLNGRLGKAKPALEIVTGLGLLAFAPVVAALALWSRRVLHRSGGERGER
jgi:hypothetical protein